MNNQLETIKQLREATQAGVMDCRKALEQANGNYEQAMVFLQEKAADSAARRADREALQGVVELYSHARGRIGVMVEINTETDFAGRSEAFRVFAHEVALQIAAAAPRWVHEAEIPSLVVEDLASEAAAKAREAGKPEGVVLRMVEGQLEKFKNEAVLLRQPYIRDESMTILQLLSQTSAAIGEAVIIRRFARWQLGEGQTGE